MNKNPPSAKPNRSEFFIKSIGYAAANLDLDSKMLEVLPVEEFGYVDGEVTDQRDTLEESGIDSKGNVYSDKIETSNTMTAEWLQWGSNRYSPPNVRRGERVLIWQYGDADKYYWTSLGMDEHLRRRETFVMCLSNTVDESTTELTSKNSYSFIASTHTKEVTIQTTKTDGESFAYIIKLDTKNGVFVVTDDNENQITLESAEKRITLVNADESTVVLDKKNITIEAQETINIKAKWVKIDGETTTVEAKNYKVTATLASVNAGKYSMSGGSIDMGGSGLIVGTGSQFNGTITNNGVNIGSTHLHKNVRSGSDNSGSPI